MVNDFKFSVLMSVYGKDNPAWFRQALQSVLNQSVAPAEVVLAADGPLTEELEKGGQQRGKEPFFAGFKAAQTFKRKPYKPKYPRQYG